jgi:TPR repeat protein
MYARGEGLTKDNRQAITWLNKAAEQGDTEAQYQLAQMCEQGLGGTIDRPQAEYWYEKAAASHDVRAQLRLGQLFEAERPQEALELYRQAAGQGSSEANFALGRIYAEGEVVDQDFDKALDFLLRAAAQGEVNALPLLAQLVDREALHMTSEWYQRAAEEGHEQAQYVIGNRLATGQGVPQNAPEALFWYMLAAEKGLPEAQHAVAEAYLAQPPSPENLDQAVLWLRKAAKQAFAKSQSLLGSLYAKGEGVPKDNRQAASWWLKAAEQGDVDAQFNLGQLFELGGGGTADRHATQWYQRAIARTNDSRAALALVKLYARKKTPEAAGWLAEAAEQGIALAQFLDGQNLQQQADGELTPDALHRYLQAAAQGEADALRRLAEFAGQAPNKLFTACLQLAGDEAPLRAAPETAQSPVSAPDSPSVNAPAGVQPTPNAISPFELCQRQAQAGDPKAQWTLAGIYAKGERGQARDATQAYHWYRQAAMAGFPAAQAALALLFATGQGVQLDNQEAVHWWGKAAEQGDAESQYNLALMYEKGVGVPQDVAQTMFWLEKAAEQGIAIAQTRLGLAHATGRLGEPDLVAAYAWFAAAAAAGNEAAQANREHAESLMNPAQLKEGRRRADLFAKKQVQKRLAARADDAPEKQ